MKRKLNPTKVQNVELVAKAAEKAIYKYDSDNVDVVNDSGKLTVMYHSDNNSFPIFETNINKKDVYIKKLEKKLDYLGIGHCW